MLFAAIRAARLFLLARALPILRASHATLRFQQEPPLAQSAAGATIRLFEPLFAMNEARSSEQKPAARPVRVQSLPSPASVAKLGGARLE